MNIIDILLLLLIIFQIRAGYKKGLILTAFGFAGNLIAFFLSYVYKERFKVFLIHTMGLNEKIYKIIYPKIVEFTISTGNGITMQNEDFLKNFPLPQAIKDQIIKQVEIGSQSIAHEIANIVVDFSITVLSAIVLYIAISLAIKIAARVLNLVAKLPIINGFNKAGGVLVSLGILYLELVLLSNALLMMSTFIHETWFLESVSSSEVMKYIFLSPFFIKFV